jgi:hypothetical protein
MPGDILWLGAHKTGTTALQDMLARAAPDLASQGIHYTEMEQFRQQVTRPLLYHDHAARTFKAPLEVAGRHVFFDENILALVQDVLAPAGLYPEGAERALKLACALQLQAPVLVLGIRNFADYLPSLYCEALKSTPFTPFARFCVTALATLSWADLVERLACAFPQSQILVYRAEDLRQREAELLSWVTGGQVTALPQPGKSQRQGFSDAAVRALHQLAKDRAAGSDTAAENPPGAEDLAACLEAHPRGAGSPAYAPWSTSERQTLDLIYQLDVARLHSLDRTTFWRP